MEQSQQGNWHPLLAAVEKRPGRWCLEDQSRREYGTVELRRVAGGELRYKAVYGNDVIGWATTLRFACERVHAAHIKSHGPAAGPLGAAPWGKS